MGLGNWLRRLLGGQSRKADTVPFYDTETKRVVRIPAAELRPGTIFVQVQGMEELVWMLADQLYQGEGRHGPFEGGHSCVHPADPVSLR